MSSPHHHYRPPPAFTFHPYHHDASHDVLDDAIAPPAVSSKRASRLSAPFPTFLYANEPPPVTARNKQRVRPSAAQLGELKALYAVTAHPTREAREALGRRIGMRYQSVTNWFQNQRSTAKRRAPPIASHSPNPAPSSSSRSRSRSRLDSPSASPSRVMHDAYPDDDDDDLRDTIRKHDQDRDDHQLTASTPTSLTTRRPRIDPVRDIIAAQAQERQQQQQHQQRIELALPLSGAAIVPSSLPDLNQHRDSPSLNITLPPASEHASTPSSTPPHTTTPTPSPRTSRAPRPPRVPRFTASHRIMGTTGLITRFPRSDTPPILSAFQVSRAPSPGPAPKPSPKPASNPSPDPATTPATTSATKPASKLADKSKVASRTPDKADSAFTNVPLFDYIYPGGLKEDTCSTIADIHSAIAHKRKAFADMRKASGEKGNAAKTKTSAEKARASAERARAKVGRARASVDRGSAAVDEDTIVDEAHSIADEGNPIEDEDPPIVHGTSPIVDEPRPIVRETRPIVDERLMADARIAVADGGGAILDMEITEQRDIMSVADLIPRGKRSRPTPRQLAVLRALHAVTSSPSIEERTRVGKEIGMELGKVTNWFRNLRQTARKKERRALEAEGQLQQPASNEGEGYKLRGRSSPQPRLVMATFDDEDEEEYGDEDSVSVMSQRTHRSAVISGVGGGGGESVGMDVDIEMDVEMGVGEDVDVEMEMGTGAEMDVDMGGEEAYGRRVRSGPVSGEAYHVQRRWGGGEEEAAAAAAAAMVLAGSRGGDGYTEPRVRQSDERYGERGRGEARFGVYDDAGFGQGRVGVMEEKEAEDDGVFGTGGRRRDGDPRRFTHDLEEYEHTPRSEPGPAYDARNAHGHENDFRNDHDHDHEHEHDSHPDQTDNFHFHEHDPESRSELGTESDAAHEAVTPEPQSVVGVGVEVGVGIGVSVDAPALAGKNDVSSRARRGEEEEESRDPHSHSPHLPPLHSALTTPISSARGSLTPPVAPSRQHPSLGVDGVSKHPTLDDAMLLLAFHSAPC